MSRSITFKLVLAFLLVSVVGVALASGITYWLTVQEFKQLTFDQARDRFAADMTFYYQANGTWDGVLNYYQLRSSVRPPLNPPSNPQLPGPGDGGPGPRTFFFALADANGHILIPAGNYRIGDVVSQTTLSQGTMITVDQKQVGTVLVIGSPPPLGTREEQYLNRTNLALLYAALGASFVALVLGIILTRALTRPIRDLTAAIRAIARGDLKQSVTVKSKDELGELAAAFNQMSADLDRLIQSRRQMTADIAHDLRNPLTVIGGYIESMREGVLKPTPERLDSIQIEVQHLQRLVEDLRTLSQADAGELSLNREPISIPALLERTVESYRPLADKQGITLTCKARPGLPDINVDPDRLAQVLGNLITNSLHYTPQGGEITLEASQEEEQIILSVKDTGHGISPEALPYIFDRFYRADPTRTRGDESGLGLAIAKSIVEAHGGMISAESQLGVGTTIKISLPL
jgi:signal transduction histidine kinase